MNLQIHQTTFKINFLIKLFSFKHISKQPTDQELTFNFENRTFR